MASTDNLYLIGVFVFSLLVGLIIIRSFLTDQNATAPAANNIANLHLLREDIKNPAKTRVKRGYTKSEVSKHKEEADCWIIVDGKVYDVTGYIEDHPGGLSILNNAGADSSEGFHGPQHPASVWDVLALYHIGHIEE